VRSGGTQKIVVQHVTVEDGGGPWTALSVKPLACQ